MKIEIPAEVYAEYKVYAAVRERSVSAVIEWALKDWFERVAEGHLEDAAISYLSRSVN
jgi:hypothetical protein